MSTYSVKSGDYLWKIVQDKYPNRSKSEQQKALDEIARINGIKDPNLIYANQQLQLPDEVSLFGSTETSDDASKTETVDYEDFENWMKTGISKYNQDDEYEVEDFDMFDQGEDRTDENYAASTKDLGKSMIDAYDTNGDGTISADEFVTKEVNDYKATNEQQNTSEDQNTAEDAEGEQKTTGETTSQGDMVGEQQQLLDDFAKIDANADGLIDYNEFENYQKQVNGADIDPSQEFAFAQEILNTFKSMDTNGDNSVSFGEYEGKYDATKNDNTTTNPTGEEDATTNPTGEEDTTTQPTGEEDTTTNPTGEEDTTTQPTGEEDTTTNPTGEEDSEEAQVKATAEQLFDIIDANDNNQIDADEAQALYVALDAYDSADGSVDGKISLDSLANIGDEKFQTLYKQALENIQNSEQPTGTDGEQDGTATPDMVSSPQEGETEETGESVSTTDNQQQMIDDFARIDANADGLIDYSEFENYQKQVNGADIDPSKEAEFAQQIVNDFKAMDANGDDAVSFFEFEAKANAAQTPDEADKTPATPDEPVEDPATPDEADKTPATPDEPDKTPATPDEPDKTPADPSGDVDREEQLQTSFSRLDANDDKVLSFDEFRAGYQNIMVQNPGQEYDVAEAALKAFKAMDTNGDNLVSYDEYSGKMKAAGEADKTSTPDEATQDEADKDQEEK